MENNKMEIERRRIKFDGLSSLFLIIRVKCPLRLPLLPV